MGNLKSKPALRKAITEGDLSVAALGDGWMAAVQESGEAIVLADALGFISRTSEDLKIQWSKEELLALQKLGTGDGPYPSIDEWRNSRDSSEFAQ